MANKDKPFDHVLIIGCGDIGLKVAKLWQKQEVSITAVVRETVSLDALTQYKIKGIQADLDTPALLNKWPLKKSLVYYFIPPPGKGTQDPRMLNFLRQLSPHNTPEKLIYISTSSVYGNQPDLLVNEQTPVNPQVDRAHRRYHAEQQLQNYSARFAVPIVILRVGGIYGPNRLPLQRIKDRIPMLYESLAPQTNRIHADDLAQVCFAAALKANPNNRVNIYNVSDGNNNNMAEYFNTIADHFGLERPPLVGWQEAEKVISQNMLSYLRESRRMDNRLMLKELEITLQYPNLKSGLKNCQPHS